MDADCGGFAAAGSRAPHRRACQELRCRAFSSMCPRPVFVVRMGSIIGDSPAALASLRPLVAGMRHSGEESALTGIPSRVLFVESASDRQIQWTVRSGSLLEHALCARCGLIWPLSGITPIPCKLRSHPTPSPRPRSGSIRRRRESRADARWRTCREPEEHSVRDPATRPARVASGRPRRHSRRDAHFMRYVDFFRPGTTPVTDSTSEPGIASLRPPAALSVGRSARSRRRRGDSLRTIPPPRAPPAPPAPRRAVRCVRPAGSRRAPGRGSNRRP